ncbi:MAG: sel1 repeat family protein, partial [Magnetococcales bacterium]|nr:sel1 repeat family protein [Magnetococcales bacterium]
MAMFATLSMISVAVAEEPVVMWQYPQSLHWDPWATDAHVVTIPGNKPSKGLGGLGLPTPLDPADVEQLKKFRQQAEGGDADGQYGVGYMYSRGLGVKQDDEEALKWFRLAAKQGHMRAHSAMGFMYAQGRGVERDDRQAVRWYRAAAERGEAEGQIGLGGMYFNGRGVPRDPNQAAEWFRKAAEQGSNHGATNLGLLYLWGKGVPRSAANAAKWFQQAADMGDENAQRHLAALYAAGKGVRRDARAAQYWSQKASAQAREREKREPPKETPDQYWVFAGDAVILPPAEHAAQRMQILPVGSAPPSPGFRVKGEGDGAPRAGDHVELPRLMTRLQRMAEAGNLAAQVSLAQRHADGTGTPRNDLEAARWFQMAAVQGDSHAQLTMGMLYAQGRGVDRNDQEAVNWFRKAAVQGMPEAQYWLGSSYARGRGVAPDLMEAVRWFRHAAEQRYPEAEFALGWLYSQGRGVESNPAEAFAWFTLAAGHGHPKAAEARDQLAGTLSSAQLAAAQLRIQEQKGDAALSPTAVAAVPNVGHGTSVTPTQRSPIKSGRHAVKAHAESARRLGDPSVPPKGKATAVTGKAPPHGVTPAESAPAVAAQSSSQDGMPQKTTPAVENTTPPHEKQKAAIQNPATHWGPG